MSGTSSPWPDDPPAVDAPAEVTADVETGAVDDEAERPAGSKGVSITVALASFGFWVAFPVLIVVGLYSVLTVYAIVKAVGSAPDQPNAVAIALSIVGLITFFVLLIALGISLVGRLADPKRRH